MEIFHKIIFFAKKVWTEWKIESILAVTENKNRNVQSHKLFNLSHIGVSQIRDEEFNYLQIKCVAEKLQ